ncbi:MAG TPA: DUF475 domain-containing protein [Patescibacteria group bacterium]|nr:DUF475 domain-containing protein [Patescibacteria group bacterium]
MSEKGQTSITNIYLLAFLLTAITLITVAIFGGPASIIPVLILAIIEVTFSFENAVINSQVLARMNQFWQTIFLTVGIAVAVFGVRLLLPVIMVSTTTGHSMLSVFQMALHEPDQYAALLENAYPLIAAFGGVFLLMIGLRFFGERRDVYWLNSVEAPLGEFNQPWWIVFSGIVGAVGFIYLFLANGDLSIVGAAILGGLTFVVIKGVGELLMRSNHQTLAGGTAHGLAALSQFVYLEMLDASFSFDGVLGAFAITKDVLLIAAGLGIGAFYVRSLTVHLLRRGTLAHYRYLVHGAHYAILVLALMLILSISLEMPKIIVSLVGLSFIFAAISSSIRHNHREALPAKK